MDREGFFFQESFSDHFLRRFAVDEIYFRGRTAIQFVDCFHNPLMGKMLFLDKKIQSAEIDEFIYHELLVHPGLLTHDNPSEVLILGGGEGATLREVLKHNTVRKATMVDIDGELVDICKSHLPEWSNGAFSDSRSKVLFKDARKFAEGENEKYDVIISDLTEPIEKGPSVFLFTQEFFSEIFRILEDDGIFVIQAGSTDTFYHDFFTCCVRTMKEVFPIVQTYWSFIFSFGSCWGFVLASKRNNALASDEGELHGRIKRRNIQELRFFHAGIHNALFHLPLYLKDGLEKGKILTDKNPFIWKL